MKIFKMIVQIFLQEQYGRLMSAMIFKSGDIIKLFLTVSAVKFFNNLK